MAYGYGLTPQQYWFGFGYGQLIKWLSARQKHEGERVREKYRIARAHAYGILRAFVGKEMPPVNKWWELPGDNEIKQLSKSNESGNDVLIGGDFVRAFGQAFGI